MTDEDGVVQHARPTVAAVVARFCRDKRYAPTQTMGHIYAAKISALSGDDVVLDDTEEMLVALRRDRIISGTRLVVLLGRHQRERCGGAYR